MTTTQKPKREIRLKATHPSTSRPVTEEDFQRAGDMLRRIQAIAEGPPEGRTPAAIRKAVEPPLRPRRSRLEMREDLFKRGAGVLAWSARQDEGEST